MAFERLLTFVIFIYLFGLSILFTLKYIELNQHADKIACENFCQNEVNNLLSNSYCVPVPMQPNFTALNNTKLFKGVGTNTSGG